jgi:hypothetical protein
MAEDKLGKTVRIDEKKYVPKGAKLEVWTKGRHKYLIKYLDPKGINAPATDTIRYINNSKISASLSDDEVIKEWLSEIEAAAKIIPSVKVYKVIQDPYSDEPAKRVYGDGKSPYYLNNGCKIFIEWSGYIPNPKFDLGTSSTAKEAQNYNIKTGGPDRYLSGQPITSSEDTSKLYDLPPFSTWVVPSGEVNSALQAIDNYRDYSSVNSKKISVYLPDGFTENGGKGYLILTKNDELKYSTDPGNNEDTNKYSSTKDANIISIVISKFKSMVQKLHGISDYDLKLCEPDSEACKLIDYKSPLEPPNNTAQQAAINDTPPGPSQSNTKIKLSIQGLFDNGTGTTSSVFEIKAKTDMPTFTIWTGDIPQTELIDEFDDLQELDEEYLEGGFTGEEEKMVEFESPSSIGEVSGESNFVSDPSSTSSYTPDPNAKPGTVVQLPRDYSHTSEQGYNLLNSKWIGDLIASAKSHIGHPTYDISGTDKGNLGCASAVSMIFYRAFGVHMKDGKAVKAKPTDIGSFGTKGTAEAAGWFENNSLYQKITWTDAQPGDIMNTARNFSTNKAGHIGVVIDVKASDGSWAIVSNSSKGFAGGGGGAVKQNYSVKAWQSVTNRNPSKTFAFRYIGPRLSSGQTA